jgi:hypothetical protein
MTGEIVQLSETNEQSGGNLFACPADLTGRWAEQFQNIADTISSQHGLEPVDVETIAGVVRAQRRAALHEQLAIDALAAGDGDEFEKQSRAANSANVTARGGLGQLNVNPKDRSVKASRAATGKVAGQRSSNWQDLL